MPKYDFRCDDCGHHFELTRSFSRTSEPAACPRDGAEATRLFSPPMDLLFYNREPLVSTGRVTIPPGALSCHDHGPPPGAQPEAPVASGSSWHARGYDEPDDGHTQDTRDGGPVPWHGYSHSHGNWLAHRHGHGQSH